MGDDPRDPEALPDVEPALPPGDPGRRRFLKIATCALGGGIGAVVAVPAVRYLLHPVGEQIVVTGDEPIDVIGLDQLAIGAEPVRVALVARTVRDGWSAIPDVPLGAVWLRRTGEREVTALSSICPHLGCAVDFHAGTTRFRCPCHDSAFHPDGRYERGPAERGLDPLPVEVTDEGRVRVTWIRYRQGGSDRTPT
jgi:menaquinol-cytochrome c reductase iron-sulfur subunit